MKDLLDDLKSGLDEIDHELLNHGEDPDQEFLGDQTCIVLVVDGQISRSREKVALCQLGSTEGVGEDSAVGSDQGGKSDQTTEVEVGLPDYTHGMVINFRDAGMSAGSASRATTSRYPRRERRSGGVVRV